MGIVNLNDSSLDGLVPGATTEFGSEYVPEDFSTYNDIFSAVTQLHRICTVTYSVPGWLPVGMYQYFDAICAFYPSSNTTQPTRSPN
ncbi:MAG: hypothetical protein Q9208_005729 [Pyrenodesmia sp. 3 TL-2023]